MNNPFIRYKNSYKQNSTLSELNENKYPEVSLYKDTPPVYVGPVRLLRWGNTSAAGMTCSFELIDNSEIIEKHPFKGLRASRASKTEGQRLFMVVNHIDSTLSDANINIHTGESILLWWAEDCAEGMKVTFKLRDGPDGLLGTHPLDGFITGRKNGSLMSIVVWAIDDEDLPEVPNAKTNRRKFEDLPFTTQSHILCRDEKFFNWLKVNINSDFFKSNGISSSDFVGINEKSDFCENVIKSFCGISSRSELNDVENKVSRKFWLDLVSLYTKNVWKNKK